MQTSKARKKKTPRPRAAQQRAVDTRRSILDAAIKEFAEHGYAGASTRTVAREAGVQHGLIVYHFDGKEGLWRAVIGDMLAAYKERFDTRLKELENADAVTRLRAVQEEMFDFSPARLDFHRIMSHLGRNRSPQLRWVVDEYFRAIYQARAELIRETQKAGKYVAGDPYHLQYIFLGSVMMTFLLAPEVRELTGRRVDSPEFLEEHKRLCLSLFFRDPA